MLWVIAHANRKDFVKSIGGSSDGCFAVFGNFREAKVFAKEADAESALSALLMSGGYSEGYGMHIISVELVKVRQVMEV